jgi:hypothetical protein
MKLLLKEDRLIYLFVICVLILMQIRSCDAVLTYQNEMQHMSSTFRAKTLKDSSVIYSQSLVIASSRSINDSLKAELKLMAIRNPDVVIKTQVKTVIKTEVQLDTIMIEKEPYIKLPRTFHVKDKWFEIGGAVNRLGMLQIDSLVSRASFTYAIGDTIRSGFFNKVLRKKDKVLSLKIDNPTMQLDGMSNIVIKEKKRWYETTAFKFGLGVVVGAGVIRATN